MFEDPNPLLVVVGRSSCCFVETVNFNFYSNRRQQTKADVSCFVALVGFQLAAVFFGSKIS